MQMKAARLFPSPYLCHSCPYCVIPATRMFPKRRHSQVQPAAANRVPRVSLEHQNHSTEMWKEKEKATWPGFLGIVFHKQTNKQHRNK